MPARNDALKETLVQHREVTITVTGRKSGRPVSIPVWFVVHGRELYLLPVQGSETQWYKNVLSKPQIQVEAGGAKGEFSAVPITDADQVSSVAERFRHKYGAGDVKKYYSKFDAAVRMELH